MSPETIANILFALERIVAVLLDRWIEKIAVRARADEMKKHVQAFRTGTEQEKDDASIGMEEKFKERTRPK
ncbi:MAG: hypothetical protein RBT63_00435 [Bdellovibrionales bacterium]|nr:hypothetical protein [Bdellovibrionales bacterium]